VRRDGRGHSLVTRPLRETVKERSRGALHADALSARRLEDGKRPMGAFAHPDLVDGPLGAQRFQDGVSPEDPVARIEIVLLVRRPSTLPRRAFERCAFASGRSSCARVSLAVGRCARAGTSFAIERSALARCAFSFDRSARGWTTIAVE